MSVGKSKAHDSAREHVSGRAEYVDDIVPTIGQLHVGIGGSPVAHGKLRGIDLDAVRASAGVVDLIVAADIPAKRDIGPVFPGDPLLVEDTIEYIGQPLFAVVATSHRQAVQAVAHAVYDIEELPALLDLEQAIADEVYVRPPHRMQRGDATAALLTAPHRLQNQIHVGGQEHFYLEGQVALAVAGEGGCVTVHSSNQNPTETQHLLAEVLGVPMHLITVITRRMGGGFGGKETHATACAVLAAIFAQRLQVAVSCRLSRRDDMVMTGKRHPFLNSYDVGFDDDGRMLAIHHVLAGQCGNSPDLSDAIVDRAMFHADNAYYLPDVIIDGLRCKSNTVSNTAFRGFGGPQGMMAIEAVMDDIAHHLQKDPLEIRKLNLYGSTERNVTPYHQTVNTFTVPQLIEQLERSSDYHARRSAINDFNASSAILKKGIALTPVKFGISFTVRHLNQGSALLHLYHDGSLQLNHGGTEMGQGLMVKVQQVVASTLGLDADRIAVMATRTDKVPNTSATAASSGTDLNGMAARNAALKIKKRLTDYLCKKHEVDASAICFENNLVMVQSAAAKPVEYSWHQLASDAYRARIPLSATGFYRTPIIHYDRETASGRPFLYYANGAAVTEVIIDSLTGESRLLRTDIVHDVGNSINPAIDRGQIEGGYIQGVGWLTCEQLMWNDAGRLLTDGPATYKIPAISDMPDVFNVDILADSPNEEATVFRSKAVGEPPLMLGMSAFSAIRHAIASLAEQRVFPALNSPATPEEILRVCDVVRASSEGSAA